MPGGGQVRRLTALALLALLGACVRLIPPSGQAPVIAVPPAAAPAPVPPVAPPPAMTALTTGLHAGPAIGTLGLSGEDASAALVSFRESCPRLVARTDASELTVPADWKTPCDAARTWPAVSSTNFFTEYFEAARVGDGSAYATGYYEPEIAGVRKYQPGFEVPVYAMPPDLVRDTSPGAVLLPDGRAPLGRFDLEGKFVPYYTRAEIEDGALAVKGLEIAWAADPIEFFFLQVQGSGRLRAPDGSLVRIGYAGQNGQAYTGIGSVMRQRGLIGEGPGQYSGSMQGIMQFLRERPDEGRALMRENKSWVFFRELTGDGPLGALGVPVRPRSSVAADPRFVPLGAPVWLRLDRGEANGLWIAQDTGGAIKGANRFDTFWGSGSDARIIAGGMSGRGEAYVLLPKGTLQRHNSR